MKAALLNEKSALAVAENVVICNYVWEVGDHRYSELSLQNSISRALLRTQKIAYLLGQIAAMEELLHDATDNWLEGEIYRHLRKLRAELEALEAK